MSVQKLLCRGWRGCLLGGLILVTSLTVVAAPPIWWTQAGPDGAAVIPQSAGEPNPLGPANLGQAKFMAKRALETIREISPVVAARIEADLIGAGRIIPGWDYAPSGSVPAQAQYAPLLIGQLKAIAGPFYQHIHDTNVASAEWLAHELELNGTATGDGIFPWTSYSADDHNRAVATIGQLKACFALHFSELAADDATTTFAQACEGVAVVEDPDGDSDGDGLTNAREILLGTQRDNIDSDHDGTPDGDDAAPTDVAIWWRRSDISHYFIIPTEIYSTDVTIHGVARSGHFLYSMPNATWSGVDEKLAGHVWNPVDGKSAALAVPAQFDGVPVDFLDSSFISGGGITNLTFVNHNTLTVAVWQAYCGSWQKQFAQSWVGPGNMQSRVLDAVDDCVLLNGNQLVVRTQGIDGACVIPPSTDWTDPPSLDGLGRVLYRDHIISSTGCELPLEGPTLELWGRAYLGKVRFGLTHTSDRWLAVASGGDTQGKASTWVETRDGSKLLKTVTPIPNSSNRISDGGLVLTGSGDIWANGTVHPMANLIDSDHWQQVRARSMASNGVIAGTATVAGVQAPQAVLLVPVDLAVDANRDGEITFEGDDASPEEKPFTFWVNDDHDIKHPVDIVGAPYPLGLGQEDVFDGKHDYDDNRIEFVRDLEDFTRLHLSVASIADQLKSGTLSLGLEFSAATGSPAIKVYRAKDSDGGMQFQLANTKGEAQLADSNYNTALGTVTAVDQFVLPVDFWDTLSSSNPIAHLIFEGVGKGKGRLQVTLYKGTEKIGWAGDVWIELKTIKQMYQRWNASEVFQSGVQWGAWPLAKAIPDGESTAPAAPQSNSEKDFVLFVHGWNMPALDKRSFADTAYKRMWQLGYKGRFGAFFWPTFYASGLQTADPRNYDGSEQRAWESSDALLGLLNELNQKYPGRVHLVAHSMGNVVASEALHKATNIVVKNYVASQAAIPADVFKLNPDVTGDWDTVLAKTFIGQNFHIPGAKAVTTPNVYAYYVPNNRITAYSSQQYPTMGKPYMHGIKGAAKWHNFLNPNDWALGLWIFNQSQKPNAAEIGAEAFTPRNYQYKQFSMMNVWTFWVDEDGISNDHGIYFGEQAASPDSTHEIFCYCAQARSNPTGRQPNVGGPFTEEINFSEYGDLHPGHSSQFLFSICERWEYWHNLLLNCDIKHIENPSKFVK